MMEYTRDESLLVVENVCLDFVTDGVTKRVLRDINLTVSNIRRPGVAQGQVAALIGRSGIGKTQLFKIMSGRKEPTSGRVLIGTDQRPVRSGDVGIVAQNYILFRRRTVMSNLMLALAQAGKTGKEARDIVHEHAAAFSLTEHLSKYPKQLSGGQRQRASILQQLLTGNHTVLMDEPFSGLDVVVLDKVFALIQRVSLMDELNTLVIVSHDIESALAISDMAFIMAIEKDTEGNPIEGARVVKTVDLAAMGLAYDPGVRDRAEFREVVRDVKASL